MRLKIVQHGVLPRYNQRWCHCGADFLRVDHGPVHNQLNSEIIPEAAVKVLSRGAICTLKKQFSTTVRQTSHGLGNEPTIALFSSRSTVSDNWRSSDGKHPDIKFKKKKNGALTFSERNESAKPLHLYRLSYCQLPSYKLIRTCARPEKELALKL